MNNIEQILNVESTTLTEAQIITNLMPLVEAKASDSEIIRDYVGKILDRVSSESLSNNLPLLIQLVRSPSYLVEAEASRLLEKIEAPHLLKHFNFLQTLVNDGDKDVRKIVKTLILKIVLAWSLEEKIARYDFAVQLQNKNNCKKAQEVGNLLVIQVMTTWETEKVKEHLPFLIKCTSIENNEFVTSEAAASLALKVFLASDSATRIINISYLASFNYYGNKVLRRQFRHLALLTIKELDKEYLPGFALFFFQCLEAKSREDRTMAWQYLLQIDPNLFPIKDLLDCQACGLGRVRRASKKLSFRISQEVLAQNLKLFLDAQSSDDRDICNLACRLATSIPVTRLRQERAMIESYKNVRGLYTKDLVDCLLYFI